MDDAFVYRSLAADDVQRYRVRFGDKVIRDRLAKALRDEPFVIRHVSIPQR